MEKPLKNGALFPLFQGFIFAFDVMEHLRASASTRPFDPFDPDVRDVLRSVVDGRLTLSSSPSLVDLLAAGDPGVTETMRQAWADIDNSLIVYEREVATKILEMFEAWEQHIRDGD